MTSTAPPPATPTPIDDIGLQDRIRQRVLADRELSTSAISVDVVNGKATLSGTVGSQSLKDRARRLASIPGVRDVDNKITVASDTTDASPSASPAVQ